MRAWLLEVALLTASTLVLWGCCGWTGAEGDGSTFVSSVAEQHYNAGVELRGQGRRLLEAIAEDDEAIRIDPRFAWAYFNRGLAYENLGEPKRALEDYSKAIRLSPLLVDAYNNKDAALAVSGRPVRDIRDYNETIRLHPRRAEAYAARSMAYIILGKDADAERDLEKAVELGFDPALLVGLFQRIKEKAAESG